MTVETSRTVLYIHVACVDIFLVTGVAVFWDHLYSDFSFDRKEAGRLKAYKHSRSSPNLKWLSPKLVIRSRRARPVNGAQNKADRVQKSRTVSPVGRFCRVCSLFGPGWTDGADARSGLPGSCWCNQTAVRGVFCCRMEDAVRQPAVGGRESAPL